jgi:hypothetical protein
MRRPQELFKVGAFALIRSDAGFHEDSNVPSNVLVEIVGPLELYQAGEDPRRHWYYAVWWSGDPHQTFAALPSELRRCPDGPDDSRMKLSSWHSCPWQPTALSGHRRRQPHTRDVRQ